MSNHIMMVSLVRNHR